MDKEIIRDEFLQESVTEFKSKPLKLSKDWINNSIETALQIIDYFKDDFEFQDLIRYHSSLLIDDFSLLNHRRLPWNELFIPSFLNGTHWTCDEYDKNDFSLKCDKTGISYYLIGVFKLHNFITF